MPPLFFRFKASIGGSVSKTRLKDFTSKSVAYLKGI